MESTTIDISLSMFYFDKRWIHLKQDLPDFDNFNILNLSDIQDVITSPSHKANESVISEDVFPSFCLSKDISECLESWNTLEPDPYHSKLEDQFYSTDLNTPHITFANAEFNAIEQSNLLCNEVFEDFIKQEISFFDRPPDDVYCRNVATNALKRKGSLLGNTETQSKITKYNERHTIASPYPLGGDNFRSTQSDLKHTTFIFHNHLIKKEPKNEKGFEKIKGVTYTIDTPTRNYYTTHTENISNNTYYSKINITIHNIPCYIQLTIIPARGATDIIVKKNYIDLKGDKLFVYARLFTILHKTEDIPWEKLNIKVKKANMGFIDKIFFNFVNSKRLTFPIFDIQRISSLENENICKRSIPEVKVTIHNLYDVPYIPEGGDLQYREVFLIGLNRHGIKDPSNKHRKTEKNLEKHPPMNNDMIFSIMKGIFYEIKLKLNRIRRFRGNLNLRRTRKDPACYLREIFVECEYILTFDGVRININEPLSRNDSIVFSLYLFLYQSIVNTGVEHLNTYDELIGKVWKITDIYITEEYHAVM